MKIRHLAAALLLGLGLAGCNDEQSPASPQTAAEPANSYHWTMLTAWPKDAPGLHSGAERLAERVRVMSGGRLSIEVHATGGPVPAREVFDSVSRGSAELGHGAAYYWKDKLPIAPFFTSLPFGLSTAQMNAWLSKGGGQTLWDEAYAPFGVKPLAAGNSGMRMGGWFNREIASLADLKGLKIRMPGLGGDILGRLGAIRINLPDDQVFSALQSGAIDASGSAGPYSDLAFRLHEAARYYYPGWQEAQAAAELLINRKAFDSLPADLQAILSEAARAANQDMLDDYLYHNALALDELKRQGVPFKRFPDEVLDVLRAESDALLDELAGQSELNGRIWASMKAFQAQMQATQPASDNELSRR